MRSFDFFMWGAYEAEKLPMLTDFNEEPKNVVRSNIENSRFCCLGVSHEMSKGFLNRG
jgi:hypothetical protein